MCEFSPGIYLKADLQETNKDDWGVGTWVVSIAIEISGDEIISMFIVILGTYQSILYLCITPKVILLLDRSETLHIRLPLVQPHLHRAGNTRCVYDLSQVSYNNYNS